jgi:hypothetical protein
MRSLEGESAPASQDRFAVLELDRLGEGMVDLVKSANLAAGYGGEYRSMTSPVSRTTIFAPSPTRAAARAAH